DILLLDINLKGKIDGIETAQIMQKTYNIPIIYLTANADEAHFNRAKSTNPYAFISKPFKKLDLERAIEITKHRDHD
uniref:response regulator n=1 Tax=Mariniflexile sp. TaxID=1979402 RepID=UPI0040478FBF